MSYSHLPLIQQSSDNQSTHKTKLSPIPTASLSAIWSKKPESPVSQSVSPIHSEEGKEDERVIMSKRELVQFTKKFAAQKIDYQEEVQRINNDAQAQANRVKVLEEQISELRRDEKYMESLIETLRDRHLSEVTALEQKLKENLKQKDDQIFYLKQDNRKLREWLEQEKMQIKRCMEFLKIKDEIIVNLEWELKNKKKQDVFYMSSKYSSSAQSSQSSAHPRFTIDQRQSKKIILRKDRSRSKSRAKQDAENQLKESDLVKKNLESLIKVLEEKNNKYLAQVKELMKKLSGAQKQLTEKGEIIDSMQQQIQELQKQLFNGKENKFVNFFGKDEHSLCQKQQLLTDKCLNLEKHIEKLTHSVFRKQNPIRTEEDESEEQMRSNESQWTLNQRQFLF